MISQFFVNNGKIPQEKRHDRRELRIEVKGDGREGGIYFAYG